jgi:transcription elongation factor Elf1
MRIDENGVVSCENCGSSKFSSPQMIEKEGEIDLFLFCGNCGQPMYTGLSIPTTADPEAVAELKAFFATPETS